jgi:hypothetical protein
MADTIFIRSILVWPKTLDIETLSQMYSAVYMKIAEIQLKLSAFLKFGDILPFSDPSTHLMIVRSHGSFALFYIYTQVILCRAYGMGQEIDQVINSLSKLREELGKIEHFEFDMFKIMLDVSKTAAGTTPLRQPQPYHYQMVKDVAEAVRRGVNITGDKEELEEKKKS